MKYLKIIFITILLLTIMIIPVNATTLTLPDLPEEYGEYEDYIIFNSPDTGAIIAVTFNNLGKMFVGTYEEYLDEVNLEYIVEYENTYHTNDILYFRYKGNETYSGEANAFKLVGDEWKYISGLSELNHYRFSKDWNNSIKKTDILYSSKDVIKLSDGSVFFFKGSWMKAGMVRPMLGIIPYLIGLLIPWAAFWKAWQFLFRTLRKA